MDGVHRRWRWHACAVVLCACVVLLPAVTGAMPRLVAPAAASAAALPAPVKLAGPGCRGAGARAARAGRARLHRAVMCLINRERARRGIRPLRRDRRLARAAAAHARDMARRRYFGHQRSGGPDLGARLRRAGWHGSAAGETIAYGCGRTASPRSTVRMWMASPGHASILLSAGYGRGGPGVAKRAPVRCGGGATWVLNVGRR
jgi:uncharacterized protein YkwD